MKQVVQNLRTGETSVVDVPVPSVKPNTALVQTAVSLVSAGTERMVVEFAEKSLLGKAQSRPDLVRQVIDKARREGILTTVEAAFNRLDQPMPLGYSSAGTIQSVGTGLQGFHAGQRVACAGGGHAVHAGYALVPKNLMSPIPDAVSFEAAAFTTLGAIALHGFRLAQAQLGERLAVVGLGLLGLLATMLARAAGCQVIGIDLDERRVALARQIGAEAVLRDQAKQAVAAFTQDRGCDAVLICADTASDDPIELAGDIARDRARVIAVGAVGLHVPRKVYYEKELTLINSRSYGPGRYDPAYEEKGLDYPPGYVRWTENRNMEAFLDLLAQGRIDVAPLITHRFPIEQAGQAYALITGKLPGPFLGVLLTYPTPDLENKAPPVSYSTSQASVTRPALPSGKNPVALGVLGAGNFTLAVMLPTLRKVPGIDLVGIASGTGLNAQHAASKFGFRYAASLESQVIEDPAINTVAILTRHDLHAAQVSAALSQGKHVFCEKPLALDETGLAKIEAALKSVAELDDRSSPLLMVGFNRRFAPMSVRLSKFFEGRHEPMAIHYRINAGFIPTSHWVQDPDVGGGRIIGEGCHFIDLLTFLVGSLPVSVHASALPDSGRYREDNVLLTLAYPEGSIGTVSYLANGDKAFSKERIEVFCGGRIAVLDDFHSLELVHNGKTRHFRSRLRQDKGHRSEWEAFSRAIMQGGGPPIPYSQLLGVARASFAAVESLHQQETVLIPSGE